MGYVGRVPRGVVLVIIGNSISSVVGFFCVNIFPVVKICATQAFAIIETTADAEDLETITDILWDDLIRADTFCLRREKKNLVLGKVAMTHDLIHVCYTPWDRPGRVSDVGVKALYIEVNAFGACACGVGDDIAGVWWAVPGGLDGGGLFGDSRVDWGAFEAYLEGNWRKKDEVRKKRRGWERTISMAWIMATGNLPEPDTLEVSAVEDEGGRFSCRISNPGLGASVTEESQEGTEGKQNQCSQQRHSSPLHQHRSTQYTTSGCAFLL